MKVNNYPVKTPAAGDRLFGSDSNGDQKQFDMSNFSATTYKVYTALLTQSGTSAPTVIVLDNSLNLNPTFTYSSTGTYLMEFNTTLDLDKSFFIMGSNTPYDDTYVKFWEISSTATNIRSLNGSSSYNGLLNKTTIEIRVYN